MGNTRTNPPTTHATRNHAHTQQSTHTLVHSYTQHAHVSQCNTDTQSVLFHIHLCSQLSLRNAVCTLEGRLLPVLHLSFRPWAFTTSAVTVNVEATVSVSFLRDCLLRGGRAFFGKLRLRVPGRVRFLTELRASV